MENKKLKTIYVRWHDSTSWTRWRALPLDDTELCVIETVGILIEEHKDRVVIAHSVSDADHCDGVLAIPKSAILHRRFIKVEKANNRRMGAT